MKAPADRRRKRRAPATAEQCSKAHAMTKDPAQQQRISVILAGPK
jgi:hypothetical protein